MMEFEEAGAGQRYTPDPSDDEAPPPEAPPPEAPPPLPARVRELSELEAEPQPSSESLFSYAYL